MQFGFFDCYKGEAEVIKNNISPIFINTFFVRRTSAVKRRRINKGNHLSRACNDFLFSLFGAWLSWFYTFHYRLNKYVFYIPRSYTIQITD